MTRPEDGFPPPGGGASSVMEAFLLRLATAGGLLCHPPTPPPTLAPPLLPPPVGLVYQRKRLTLGEIYGVVEGPGACRPAAISLQRNRSSTRRNCRSPPRISGCRTLARTRCTSPPSLRRRQSPAPSPSGTRNLPTQCHK
ncbi:hypothetical protein QLX08_010669 [Tetragonisca angustula]|uniref:Uncharacterized protein n=1 Tax=Tetragonisca angustula TaxID=166442 RepID=A0AAW0ZBT0_9HYME